VLTLTFYQSKIRHVAKLRSAPVPLLLLGLLGLIALVNPATASPETVKWTALNIPAAGKSGNWVLAPGSDVRHLTMADDGTIYSYANPTGTNYTLFKLKDGGYS
jgi:hypothetical protein